MKMLLSTIGILMVFISIGMLIHVMDEDAVVKYSRTVERAKSILMKGDFKDLLGSDDAWGRGWTSFHNTQDVLCFVSCGSDISNESDDIHIRYNVSTHSFEIVFMFKGRMYCESFFE